MSFFKDIAQEYDKTKKRHSYSLKRICIIVMVPYVLLLGAYIVLSDRLLDLKTVNIYAIQVFNTIFIFVAYGLGLNLASYVKNKEPEQ
jgi:hypothetical protein